MLLGLGLYQRLNASNDDPTERLLSTLPEVMTGSEPFWGSYPDSLTDLVHRSGVIVLARVERRLSRSASYAPMPVCVARRTESLL